MRQQGVTMARLEIPALYRLDIGSNGWGWHKMADLTTAVNTLMERSLFSPLNAEEIGRKFARLNKEALFAWSDGQIIDLVPMEMVPWSKPDLFVPAEWGIRVIREVKAQIKLTSQEN